MTISNKFDPSAQGAFVKFLGFDLTGKPGPYSLRVKTASDAANVVKKLKEEVEAITAEEGS
jgi:nucleoporin NUP2